MGTKIKGGDLMLFVDGKTIAYATNHTLNINGETQDTSNKDEGGGDWGSQEISILNWDVSSDSLYSENGEGNNYDQIFDLMVAKTPVDAIFALKAENATEVPTGGWTSKPKGYKGKVVVSSLTLNAQNGEYANFTANFQGVGALEKLP